MTTKEQQLLQFIRGYDSCIVAYSGGVDSAVVAKAAYLALGAQATAVMADSPSVAAGELQAAEKVAREIGIRFQTINTLELQSKAYTQNAPDRCYHCKSELYNVLSPLRTELHANVIFNGTNVDDLGDYRPGLQAAEEQEVVSPLAACDFSKADVRKLAHEWNLAVADKPATPCLSSRIAYGQSVTPERLRMIDAAEQHLRSLGIAEVRVRYHAGEMARIEIPPAAFQKLMDSEVQSALVAKFTELGFRFVTLDLQGFRTGSLNQLVQLESETA